MSFRSMGRKESRVASSRANSDRKLAMATRAIAGVSGLVVVDVDSGVDVAASEMNTQESSGGRFVVRRRDVPAGRRIIATCEIQMFTYHAASFLPTRELIACMHEGSSAILEQPKTCVKSDFSTMSTRTLRHGSTEATSVSVARTLTGHPLSARVIAGGNCFPPLFASIGSKMTAAKLQNLLLLKLAASERQGAC